MRAFEGLLVKEFRACQALLSLTKEERQALSRGDVASLLNLAECKENLLDRLERLDETRHKLLDNLGGTSLTEEGQAQASALTALQASLDPEETSRWVNLQEGTLVLMVQIRELTQCNRALAALASENAGALQMQLMKLWGTPAAHWIENLDHTSEADPKEPQEPLEENPSLTVHSNRIALPALFAAIVAAREALKAQDNAALSTAIGDLQSALEHLGKFLERDSVSQGRLGGLDGYMEEVGPVAKEALSPQRETNLVEMMADLYNRETAYQAVLKTSNRMLAGT